MLKAKRYLCLLLVIVFLILTSCGNDGDANKNDKSSDDKSQQDAKSGGSGIEGPVPDNVTFGGRKVRVLAYSGNHNFMVTAEEASGDIELEAKYKRNQAVETKLEVIFESIVAEGETDANDRLKRSVNSGTNDYDLVSGQQWTVAALTTENIFMDISLLPYLDLEQPWWAKDYCEEMQIGRDKMFFLVGDWHTGMLMSASAMFVNKTLYKNEVGDPDDMYKTVLEGNWTLDAYAEMIKGVYKDLDGSGRNSADDQFGTAVSIPSLIHQFTYGAGIRFSTRDEDGLPVLDIVNERNASFAEKIYNIYFKNPGTRYVDTNLPENSDQYKVMRDMFAENRLLFYPDRLSSARSLREIVSDFMIIPYPKFDVTDTRYYSHVHDGMLLCVPTTCALPETMLGAVMEELAYQGYKYMTPAFFEVAMKAKYMRDSDDISMQVIELIRESMTTDFTYVYMGMLEGGGTIMHSLLQERSFRLASAYQKIEGSVESALQSLIDAYLY